jgi:predicted RND superfamily exporter protein
MSLRRKPIVYAIVAFSVRHAVAVICAFLAISAFFAYFAVRLEMSPDVETLLPEGEKMERLMKEYGGGELPGESLVVAIRGNDLFELPTLTAFGEMLDRIETLPEIRPGITCFNMLGLERAGRQIRMMPLSPGREAPRTEEELRAFEERIRSSPIARNLVISQDATVLLAIFTCEKTLDYAGLMDRVRSITRDYEGKLDIIVSGSVPFLERTGIYLAHDLSTLLVLAALIILLSYYLGFRAFRGIVLPFVVVALGTVWCLGFMTLVGFSLTIVTIVIPPLVLTLGSSYAIHVLNQYYREAGTEPRDKIWIAGSVFHVNRTILMAAATTIAGLLSLLSVALNQIWHFAVATSFGVAACAMLSLFLLPAALSLLPHPGPARSRQVLTGLLSRLMMKLAGWVLRFRVPLLASAGLLAVVFALTVGRLVFTTDTISYFPKHDQVVKDMHFLTEKIGGFDEINLTLLAPESRENYFLQPGVLDQVSRLERELRARADIGYVSSFVTYLDYVGSMMNEDGGTVRSRAPVLLLSRVFRSLSADENVARYLRIMVSEDFSRLTLSMRVFNSRTGKFIDEQGLRKVLSELERSVERNLDGQIKWAVWGTSLRFLAVADMVRKDLVTSVLFSLGAILLIACVAFRSVRYGLYTLVPLLVGLMVNFVLMVLLSIPLDATTFMVSSVTIGVGVDDAIHFLFQYRRQKQRNPHNMTRVFTNTLSITGRPILLTTVAIVSGLLVLVLASFKPIMYFGILVIIALSATCLATLLVLPAVLSVTGRFGASRSSAALSENEKKTA